MISTGIIRSIDSLGRVVLPKELRRTFEITTDTPLEIMTEGDAILLRKYRPADACVLCGQVSPARYSCTAKPSAPPARERWPKRSRDDLLL